MVSDSPRSTPNVDRDGNPDASLDALVCSFSAVFGKLMGYATTDWINIDMSLAQIKVVMVLHYLGSHTNHQLAERLQIGAPTASHLVKKLVQAGLASRLETASDRRLVEVHLTDQGHALVKNLSGARDRIIAEWVVQLTVEQRQTLEASLQALLTIIENTPR